MHIGTNHRTLRTIAAELRQRPKLARILFLGRLLRAEGGSPLAVQFGPVLVHAPRALSTAREPVAILGRAAHAVLAFTPSLEFVGHGTPRQPPIERSPALLLLHHGRAFATLKVGPTTQRLLRTLIEARADEPDQFVKSHALALRLKVPAASVRKTLGRLAGILDLLGFQNLLQSGRDGYRLLPDHCAPLAEQGGSDAGV